MNDTIYNHDIGYYVNNLPLELQNIIYKYHRIYIYKHVLSQVKRPAIYEIIDLLYADTPSNVVWPMVYNHNDTMISYHINSSKRRMINRKESMLESMYKQWAIDCIWDFKSNKKIVQPYLGKVVINKYIVDMFGQFNRGNAIDWQYIYRFNLDKTIFNTHNVGEHDIWQFAANLKKIHRGVCDPYLTRNSPYIIIHSPTEQKMIQDIRAQIAGRNN